MANFNINGHKVNKNSIPSVFQDYYQTIHRDLDFQTNQKLGKVVVKIMDPSTQKVIREMSSEGILQLSNAMHNGTGSFHKKENKEK